MAEFINLDRALAMSKAPETTYGELVEVADDLMGIITTATAGVSSPKLNKFDDKGKLGNGNEFATTIRNDFWDQPTLEIADDLNTGTAGILTKRAAGGTHTPTVVLASEVWDHDFGLQTKAQGRQLPGTTVWDVVGGENWGFSGGVVGQIQVSQTGAEPPKFSAQMRFLGFHKSIADVSPTLTLPEPDDLNYTFGADVLVEFNNGSLLNISNRIKSVTFTLNNNPRENDRRPGDPPLVDGDYTQGAYTARMLRGERDCTFQVVLTVDENQVEYDAMRNNTIITGLRYRSRGPAIADDSGTTYYHEYEIRLPKSVIMEAARGGDNDVTRTVMFMPLKGASDYVRFRIRNNSATLL